MTKTPINPNSDKNDMDSLRISQTPLFANEPLDDKDRQILLALRDAGPQGLGFNSLVEKVQTSVSRSTVAVRIEKLVRLGYVTKKQSERAGKIVPISLSKNSELLFTFISMSKGMNKKLLQELEELGADNFNKEHFEKWYSSFRDSFNSAFGMTTVVAVLFGVSAASNLFIPMLMDDYNVLIAKLNEIIRNKSGASTLFRSLIDTKLKRSGTSITKIMKQIRTQINAE
jgi:DNA-binding Lrp family transcriptional regulator